MQIEPFFAIYCFKFFGTEKVKLGEFQKLVRGSKEIPIFGICLGHQLLSLACGAKTEKMKFGHHGANHPVKDLITNRVFITSQNHGFTVKENSLPDIVRISHRSLFDDTIQGISHSELSVFSFQGHPEASPGPQDISSLFNTFLDNMKSNNAKKN